MPEKQGRVLECTGSTVVITIEPPLPQSCQARCGVGGCQRRASNRHNFSGRAQNNLIVAKTASCTDDYSRLSAGQRVRVVLPHGAAVWASFTVYLTPLLGMLSGAIVAALGGLQEPATVSLAIVGLVAGGCWARRWSNSTFVQRLCTPRLYAVIDSSK